MVATDYTGRERTYEGLLKWARGELSICDVPALDARLLMLEVAEMDHATLIMRGEETPDENIVERFCSLVERRKTGEPIAYILGRREFWERDFEINTDVLIPRPETETLIELALAKYHDRPPKNILDLGTGSGCVLVTLLALFEQARGVGVDICTKALSVAARNIARYNLTQRAALVCGDYIAPELFSRDVDLVVSNPPYVAWHERASLAPDVIDFEPEKALFGGPDGMEEYRRLLAACALQLQPSCTFILEIGATQGPVIAAMAQNCFPEREITCHNDLAGQNRAIMIA